MNSYDIIIIGAGPAGLTAGIYAGRQGHKTLLIDKGICGGLGLEVPSMENYPGFEIIAGMSLVSKMKKQAEKYIEIQENEEVLKITKTENGFEIKTVKDSYYARSIIIATGTKHKKLNIPGEEEFKGKGVSFCATCDGLLYKDKEVIVVGGGNSALQEGIFLSNVGADVTIVHRRDEFRAEANLQEKIKQKGIKTILNSQIKEINGKNFVESVTLLNKDGTEKEVQTNGVFISIGFNPCKSIVNNIGIKKDDREHIITDKEQKTNVKYTYAAGDITGGLKQWVVACGEGAIAATSAYNDLEK
ncbi:thioredoxin reductase [Methanobrevibacter filiformis]|uniref:Thioredoxin reductase n=2 Tax=Methanobrevibacter filiformis TaxID=55758 RepID=A0A166CDX2_9EURY|nr:thioredoxin reductase [Methanobrevibacter filiformis]